MRSVALDDPRANAIEGERHREDEPGRAGPDLYMRRWMSDGLETIRKGKSRTMRTGDSVGVVVDIGR
jgi:hypothetical protein